MIEPLSALGAAAAPSSAGAAGPSNPSVPAGGPSFSEALGQVVSDAIGSLQSGEAAAIQGVKGAMSPFRVAEAVMGAQRTLQTTLAIRDKAVAAYQEISRMAI